MIKSNTSRRIDIFHLFNMYLILPFKIDFTGTTQGNGRSLKMAEIDETDASKIKGFSKFFTELFGAMNNKTDGN